MNEKRDCSQYLVYIITLNIFTKTVQAHIFPSSLSKRGEIKYHVNENLSSSQSIFASDKELFVLFYFIFLLLKETCAYFMNVMNIFAIAFDCMLSGSVAMNEITEAK